jgi:hypothetical protein
MGGTCPVNIILFYLITVIMLGKEYKLRSYSLRSFSNIISLRPTSVQILYLAPFSQTSSVCIPLLVPQSKFYTYTKPPARIRVLHILF